MGRERGYEEVKTPLIFDAGAVEDLGALGQVPRKNMFTVKVEEREMGVSAMNLPRARPPVCLPAPLLSGPCRALLRARPAAPQTSPPACCTGCCGSGTSRRMTRHIFCTEEQVQEEVRGCLELAFSTYALFDFGRAPGALDAPGRAGSARMRCGDKAEEKLKNALDRAGSCSTSLNPGDGALSTAEDPHAT